ncbi:hypothetical protein [Larkinella humicola]|uniref:hypothetical protein n=1 Tax=Larkinella humicola TaxID=2607654 RepID=UPI00177B1A30|nr:hypothetical protein [Larkinella humicola]
MKKRAQALQILVIFVNDNVGRWRSDSTEVVAHCLKDWDRQTAPVLSTPTSFYSGMRA